jgi:hypothetical protein
MYYCIVIARALIDVLGMLIMRFGATNAAQQRQSVSLFSLSACELHPEKYVVTNITTFQGFPMAKCTQIWNFPHYLDPSFYRIEEYLPGRLLIIFIVSLDITYRSGRYCRYRGRYIYRLYRPYRTKH